MRRTAASFAPSSTLLSLRCIYEHVPSTWTDAEVIIMVCRLEAEVFEDLDGLRHKVLAISDGSKSRLCGAGLDTHALRESGTRRHSIYAFGLTLHLIIEESCTLMETGIADVRTRDLPNRSSSLFLLVVWN